MKHSHNILELSCLKQNILNSICMYFLLYAGKNTLQDRKKSLGKSLTRTYGFRLPKTSKALRKTQSLKIKVQLNC